MPTLPASHFVIDLPTLFIITVFLSVTGGLLLLFAWLQNRRTTALALWGIGYLFGASAAALLGSPGLLPNWWSVCIANTFMCIAYGTMWAGARSFEGRRVHIPLIGARRGDLDCRFSVRGFCRLAAGTRAARIGDHGLLRALECP